MRWQEDARLWTLMQQLLTAPSVRREIVEKGANTYLKERGVDIPVDISVEVEEETNTLRIKVKDSGKSFKGSLHLEVS